MCSGQSGEMLEFPSMVLATVLPTPSTYDISYDSSNSSVALNAEVAGDLTISRLSRTHGSVRGGDELFLLCSSIKKGVIVRLLTTVHSALTYYVCIDVTLDVPLNVYRSAFSFI